MEAAADYALPLQERESHEPSEIEHSAAGVNGAREAVLERSSRGPVSPKPESEPRRDSATVGRLLQAIRSWARWPCRRFFAVFPVAARRLQDELQ
jgi:hypothetical protein